MYTILLLEVHVDFGTVTDAIPVSIAAASAVDVAVAVVTLLLPIAFNVAARSRWILLRTAS